MFTIKVMCDDHTYRQLDAQHFAQSAIDNNIDPISFECSLNNFSEHSSSTKKAIAAWRDEAIRYYFDTLLETGKMILKPTEFKGGSDFPDDTETTLDDININTNERNN